MVTKSKRITKIHCYNCGKNRNSDIFIQSRPMGENNETKTLKLKLTQLYEMLKRKTLETNLLLGGVYMAKCPSCNIITPFMVNKNRKLTVVWDMIL